MSCFRIMNSQWQQCSSRYWITACQGCHRRNWFVCKTGLDQWLSIYFLRSGTFSPPNHLLHKSTTLKKYITNKKKAVLVSPHPLGLLNSHMTGLGISLEFQGLEQSPSYYKNIKDLWFCLLPGFHDYSVWESFLFEMVHY